MRAINARWKRVGPSTRKSNKTAEDSRIRVGTEQDNKVVEVPK